VKDLVPGSQPVIGAWVDGQVAVCTCQPRGVPVGGVEAFQRLGSGSRPWPWSGARSRRQRLQGADVASETQDMEGVGRFGWVTDPEGTRVELWVRA
jgi:hypothetical protein